MSDVFISYRRGDGAWAGRLSDHLKEEFAVFFDIESIGYGDIFPAEIKDALGECQVVLVVVGADWVKPENINRLGDEKDWVLQEIRISLQKPTVKIVPVIVGVSALMPKVPEKLPLAIQPLLNINWCEIRHEKWDEDCQALSLQLENALKRHRPSDKTRSGIPVDLPYLCDRKDQENALKSPMQKPLEYRSDKRPVCILHGYRYEGHFKFVVRLQHTGLLNDIFGVPQDSHVGVYQIDLDWKKVKNGGYVDAFRGAIKQNIIPKAKPQDLLHNLSTLQHPELWVLQVTWSDYQACGEGVFQNLVHAWRSLFTNHSDIDNAAVITPYPIILWINFSYDDSSREIAFALKEEDGILLLDKLTSITGDHIEKWIILPQVSKYTVGRDSRLMVLAENKKYYHKPGEIHMVRFADAVHEILSD